MKMGMRTHPGEVYSQNDKAKDRKGTLLRLFKLVMTGNSSGFLSPFITAPSTCMYLKP